MIARLAVVGALLLAGGCAREQIVELRGETMGTWYAVRVVGDPARAATAKERVDALLEAVNDRFSTWRDDSLISRFNAHRGDDPFAADAEFVAVLGEALEIARRTDGAYDPTILPVVRALDFGPGGDGAPPAPEELSAALARVGHEKVEVVDATHVRKLDSDVEVDLSSIAKGAGADRVSELLVELGFPDHMVEIGGEVVCRGTKPGGAPWRIGIERPPAAGDRDGRPVQEVVELRDAALATSGSYRNFHEYAGRRTHHVPDARTGQNVDNGVVSVSVIAEDCATADAWATALMVIGPEAARAVVAEFGLEVLFLVAREDGALETVALGWRSGD